MADLSGDPEKQTKECASGTCPNLRDVSGSDMSGERYDCLVCGQRFRLYYEDMA